MYSWTNGYYGYFIILANRFLKDEGKLALVLPASVLNADGLLKVKEFLTTNYHIEHIITTWQRAAFSENAQFREVLLIAKKEMSRPEDFCVITELKVLPRDLSEAKKIAEKLFKHLTLENTAWFVMTQICKFRYL